MEIENAVENWTLKGNKLKCPKCGGTKNLSRNEYVAVNTYIDVDSNGKWKWSDRESKVCWETSDYYELWNEPEWHCHDCDIDFDAPDLPIPYVLKSETEVAELKKAELINPKFKKEQL